MAGLSAGDTAAARCHVPSHIPGGPPVSASTPLDAITSSVPLSSSGTASATSSVRTPFTASAHLSSAACHVATNWGRGATPSASCSSVLSSADTSSRTVRSAPLAFSRLASSTASPSSGRSTSAYTCSQSSGGGESAPAPASTRWSAATAASRTSARSSSTGALRPFTTSPHMPSSSLGCRPSALRAPAHRPRVSPRSVSRPSASAERSGPPALASANVRHASRHSAKLTSSTCAPPPTTSLRASKPAAEPSACLAAPIRSLHTVSHPAGERMCPAAAFTSASTSVATRSMRPSATRASSEKTSLRLRRSSSASSSLYGTSLCAMRSRSVMARSTRGLGPDLALCTIAFRWSCTIGQSRSMRSRLRSVTWMRSSRQKSAVSSSCGEAPPTPPAPPRPGAPAAHTSALHSSSSDSPSRNLESEKTSSMRHASTHRAVRCSASASRSLGVARAASGPPSRPRRDVKPLLMLRRTPPVPLVLTDLASLTAFCGRRSGVPSPASPPASSDSFVGSMPSLCMRSTQSRMLHQPSLRVSPCLLATENTVTAAILALVSSPKATDGRTAGLAVGLRSAVNLHRLATRLSMTLDMRCAEAMRATARKPSRASRSTLSSSAWSNTTEMAAMAGPQMMAKRSPSNMAAAAADGTGHRRWPFCPWYPRMSASHEDVEMFVSLSEVILISSVVIVS
mmetsp:Transcript_17190/g.58775  ORF Transcript_17190/g.58775 Transcript_17190/m.58775 type:complete len:684 (+) Transcript_17190:266-2317(+)